MSNIIMNREDIKKIIPHREPMLLIDDVLEMEPEKRIVARFLVDKDRDIFKGHFPGDPVLPGVYTVEIMAQASDILILSCEKYAGKTPLFIGINKVRFLGKIRPGDTLEIHSEISLEKEEKAIVTCSAKVYSQGASVCEGDVTLAMR